MRALKEREILFRGKDKTGAWQEGNLVTMQDKFGMQHSSIIPKSPWGERYPIYEVYNDTVGQYTGMHDRNGKKIFEGDVVHWWDTACYIYKTDENDEPIPPEGAIFFMGYVDTRDNGFVLLDGVTGHFRFFDYQMEVIGNIFDNPELLEAIEA